MVELTISVEGMSCGHCKAAVEGTLTKISGVVSAEVNLAAKNVTVKYESEKVTEEKLKAEIEDAGYDVV